MSPLPGRQWLDMIASKMPRLIFPRVMAGLGRQNCRIKTRVYKNESSKYCGFQSNRYLSVKMNMTTAYLVPVETYCVVTVAVLV